MSAPLLPVTGKDSSGSFEEERSESRKTGCEAVMTPKKFLLMLLPFLAIISCWCLGMLVLIFLMAIQDTFDVELDLDFGFAFQVRNIQILPIFRHILVLFTGRGSLLASDRGLGAYLIVLAYLTADSVFRSVYSWVRNCASRLRVAGCARRGGTRTNHYP